MTRQVSAQELADRLGVSIFTVRRLVRQGRLRAEVVDGEYRIDRSDLAAFLRDRELPQFEANSQGEEERKTEAEDQD